MWSSSIPLATALLFLAGSHAQACVPSVGSPAGASCGTYGYINNDAYQNGLIPNGQLDGPYIDSIEACLVMCQQTASCVTVIFQQGEVCQLLSAPASTLDLTTDEQVQKVYEVACLVGCSTTSSSTPPTPSSTTPAPVSSASSTSSKASKGKCRLSRTSSSAPSSPTITPTITSSPSNSTSSVPLTTSTVFTTIVSTVIHCAPTVTNCPARSTVLVTSTVALYTTVCPVSATKTSSPKFTTSVVYTTELVTVTACPASVVNCPARQKTETVVTSVRPLYTTVCPVTATGASYPAPSGAAGVPVVPAGGVSPVVATSVISGINSTASAPPAPFTAGAARSVENAIGLIISGIVVVLML